MKSKFIGRLLSFTLSASLAATTFSTTAFAAETDLEQAEEITFEEVIEEDTLEDVDEFTEEFEEEAPETEETEEFFEDDIIVEEFEEIAEEDAEADLQVEESEEGTSDISGNDSEDDYADEYTVTYEFMVDGEAASEEVLATIINPNKQTRFTPDNEDYGYARVELLEPEAPDNLVFLGWYADGTKLSNYSEYNEDAEEYVSIWYKNIYVDTTFTAKFASLYEVTLVGANESSQIIDVRKGKKIDLIVVDEPKNPGYFFTGWYTEKDGGNKVDLKTQVITENVTYYAHWDEVNYTVKFHSDEKSKDVVTKNYKVSELKEEETFGFADIYTDESKYADIIAKADEFKGWTSASEYYPGTCRVLYMMESEAVTGTAVTVDMYAQWSEDSYTVVFDAKGDETINLSNEYFGESDFSVSSPEDLVRKKTFFVGDGVLLTGREFVRDGYTLTGWKNSATGKTIAATGNFEDLAKKGETVTLTAQWKAENYTIEYDFNGGKAVDKAKYPAKVTYTKANTPQEKALYNYTEKEHEEGYTYFTLSDDPVITKTGYRLVYWENEDGNMPYTYGGEGNYKNLKLKAYWTSIYYYVDFDLNGGYATSGWTGGSFNFYYNSEYSMTSRVGEVYRDGYTFAGWKYDSNGNGKIDDGDKTLSAKAKIKNLTDKQGQTILAQAQWKANLNIFKWQRS